MEVNLSPDQKAHADYLLDKIQDNIAVGDTSLCGAGKTFVSLYLAQELEYPVLVFCPNNVKEKWRRLTQEYQVEVIDILNYDRLSGRKSKVNHPWLEIRNGVYQPTPKYREQLEEGVLIIFDEVHFLKNPNSLRSRAGFALTREVGGTPSRCVLLSNTPIVETKFALSLVRLMGIVRIEGSLNLTRLYQNRTLFSQLIGYCSHLNPDLTDRLRSKYPPRTNSNAVQLSYLLYTRIIKKELVSSLNYTQEIKIYNRFYNLPPSDKAKVTRGYSRIWGNGSSRNPYSNFGSLSNGVSLIEEGKLPTLVRILRSRLHQTTHHKIIVFVQRIKSMIELKERLRDYHPEIINGTTPIKLRRTLIDRFQQPDLQLRVLITNTQVSGTGLDLDDQDGNYPREVYILPSYSYIDDYQGIRRISRMMTRSTPVANFVYSNGDPDEKILLNQIRKSGVHQEVVHREQDAQSVSQHITWREE